MDGKNRWDQMLAVLVLSQYGVTQDILGKLIPRGLELARGNENMKYGCACTKLCAPSIIRPLSRADIQFK